MSFRAAILVINATRHEPETFLNHIRHLVGKRATIFPTSTLCLRSSLSFRSFFVSKQPILPARQRCVNPPTTTHHSAAAPERSNNLQTLSITLSTSLLLTRCGLRQNAAKLILFVADQCATFFTEVAFVLRPSSIVNRPSVFTFSHSAPATTSVRSSPIEHLSLPFRKTYPRPVLQPIAVKQDAISHRAIKPSAPAAPVVIAVWWMSVFLPLQASTTDAPPIPQEDGASDWTC
jgi:hypothetical protein